MGYNELLFLSQTIITLMIVLLACRLGRLWLTAFVAVATVLMNVVVLKQVTLWHMPVTCGNVLYGAVFLSTDLLAEHYGKKTALRAVRIGFAASVLFVIVSQFVLMLTPNQFDKAHQHMKALFGLVPRIVAASMLSYIVVQHLDVYLFEKIRQATRGRFLWLRNNGSTWTSQAIDTLIFHIAAFWGNPDFQGQLATIMLFTYIVKIIVAMLDTPFIYLSRTSWFRPRDTARAGC